MPAEERPLSRSVQDDGAVWAAIDLTELHAPAAGARTEAAGSGSFADSRGDSSELLLERGAIRHGHEPRFSFAGSARTNRRQPDDLPPGVQVDGIVRASLGGSDPLAQTRVVHRLRGTHSSSIRSGDQGRGSAGGDVDGLERARPYLRPLLDPGSACGPSTPTTPSTPGMEDVRVVAGRRGRIRRDWTGMVSRLAEVSSVFGSPSSPFELSFVECWTRPVRHRPSVAGDQHLGPLRLSRRAGA